MKKQKSFQRPFLKWAGNKYQILDKLLPVLPKGNRLVEIFAGSCAVFLNTEFDRYLINDNNPDLIHLFRILQEEGGNFIEEAKPFFKQRNNREDKYYEFRSRFNRTKDKHEKSYLFLYLNRHGYNGLVRYNKDGKFNVPFGRHKNPYFPQKEMFFFYEKSKKAQFTCIDFTKISSRIKKENVVYADPPYLPLNNTSNFTSYNKNKFGIEEQKTLASQMIKLNERGVKVLISNHDTPITRTMYSGANITSFKVQRYISCRGDKRTKINELLALYR